MRRKSQYQMMESTPAIMDPKIEREKSYRKLNELKRSFKS